MSNAMITNNILLIFTQGVYFLLIAIFACKLLRQYRVRIKLFTGILLFVWVLLNIKDMIMYYIQINSILEKINWVTMMDQLAVPLTGIVISELINPRSLNLVKVSIHLLPFVVLLLIYCVTHNSLVLAVTIANAIIYSVYIIIYSYRSIRKNTHSAYEHKAIFNIVCSFVCIVVVWALSCIIFHHILDIIYYIISGIAWYIIYINIDNTYPLENIEPIQNEVESLNDIASHKKEYQFISLLNKLFEEERIYLNPELTLNDVARLVGTNRTYLSEYFNHECNTSFNDYINNLRLTYAEKLLSSNNELSIEEIATIAGFNSISTFRRVFTKKYGISPSHYRHNLK